MRRVVGVNNARGGWNGPQRSTLDAYNVLGVGQYQVTELCCLGRQLFGSIVARRRSAWDRSLDVSGWNREPSNVHRGREDVLLEQHDRGLFDLSVAVQRTAPGLDGTFQRFYQDG